VLIRPHLLLTILVALLIVPVGVAYAQGPECAYVDENGRCTITITPPSAPGVEPVSGGDGGGTDGGAQPDCAEYGVPVPCSDPARGSYSNDLQCYLRPMSPQPPPDSPLWEGNYPDGAVYNCSAAGSYAGTIGGGSVWLPGPPDGGLTPAAAARAVVARMNLRAADIGIVPEDRPGSIGAVGAPVYMWTTAGPATFGPQVLTASAGGVTIRATAKVDKIVWSMGDGTSVTCRTPGTPYEDRYGFSDSPDCGHRYTRTSAGRPNNAYPVSATSYWVVDWTGPAGSSGRITLDLVSRTSIVVGELQALVTS
jgi:hypothetical protein